MKEFHDEPDSPLNPDYLQNKIIPKQGKVFIFSTPSSHNDYFYHLYQENLKQNNLPSLSDFNYVNSQLKKESSK